jgi:hypothetical protein
MAKRKRYYVNPREDGRWEVTQEGAKRASAVSDTKAETVRRGAGIAKDAGRSQPVIRKKDGTFQSERTYGDDPYPPKG